MQGWIKLHRKILDNELWNDVSTFRLFTLLLLKAAHKDGVKINGVELKQGQYIRSYRKLAEDLSYKEGRGLKQYSTGTIKRCFAKLIKNGMVTIDETELGTLITVVNYASYQHLDSNEHGTKNETINEPETKSKRTLNNNKNEEELKNKEDEDRAREKNPFIVFQENFNVAMNSIVADSISSWCNEMGDDIVIAAMKTAAKSGGRTFKYIENILIEWSNARLTTLDEVRKYETNKLKRNNTVPFPQQRRQTKSEVDAILNKYREG